VTDRVEFETSLGAFVLGLYGKQAPGTVANFLRYVEEGFYSGKIFHRVIPGFVIQGGGFDASLSRIETHEPIALEIVPGLKHEPGVVSMARTTLPKSATSQFFVCTAAAPQLNGGYAAFGKVESGLEVVEKISMVPTGKRQSGESETAMEDVPLESVVILGARRL
jgi:cyclophilin family peptidyl-prolyl cis-trans isomerase